MARWAGKMLKYNPGEKSLKALNVIHLDLQCLLKKLQYHNNNNSNTNNNNNIEESYTEKKARHEPCGWSMFTRFSFDKKENALNYYTVKTCTEKLCKKSKRQTMKIINYEEKEMIPLTKEENKFYDEQEISYICKEKFYMHKSDKNYINKRKVKDHCHYTGKLRGAA